MKKSKSKALKNFKKKSYDVVLGRAGTVITTIRKTDKFAGAEEKIKKVEVSYADCETKYRISKKGTSSEKDAAQKAKEVLENDLSELVDAVNLIANGDRELLNLTGFSLSKDTLSNKVVGAIINFVADNGINGGEVLLSYDAQAAIKASAFAYTLGDGITNPNWQLKFTSQSTAVVTGLTPGTTVTFQVTAIGPHDQIVVSQMITVAVGYNKAGTARKKR